ncbi:hypothetical protein [Nonomuraea sp. NPDC050786]|uniref:hypothetical protein n=1 Tax=Nonomuraea sp. NPDC050786 TaxID=3154840 RepID=UPI0033C377C7
MPDDDVERAALAPYASASVALVEAGDAECPDLFRAGRALVRQAEQGALSPVRCGHTAADAS